MNGHFHQYFHLHSYNSGQIISKYKHMLVKPRSPFCFPLAVLFLLKPVAYNAVSANYKYSSSYTHVKPSSLHNIIAVLHYIFTCVSHSLALAHTHTHSTHLCIIHYNHQWML